MKYLKMKAEQLLAEDDNALVIPVRKKDRPHFRRLTARTSVRVGPPAECDETHKHCIEKLMRALRVSETRFVSPTFDEDDKLDPNGQVLVGPFGKSDYRWWDDTGGTRIPIGNGRYIQPDICGLAAVSTAFWPQSEAPAIIIEVVQTHFPDKETLFELLHLSELNFLIFLYFIAPGRTGTKYSRMDLKEPGKAVIRIAHYFSNRQLFENGEPKGMSAPREPKEYDEWHAAMECTFRNRVMTKKDELPPSIGLGTKP